MPVPVPIRCQYDYYAYVRTHATSVSEPVRSTADAYPCGMSETRRNPYESFEVLVFSSTVFYSVQLVLRLSSVSEDGLLRLCQAEDSLFYRSKKNCTQIVHCLEEEGYTASRVGVAKFLRRYKETGTIARVPGTGQATKGTPLYVPASKNR